jgi:hypothetical protein
MEQMRQAFDELFGRGLRERVAAARRDWDWGDPYGWQRRHLDVVPANDDDMKDYAEEREEQSLGQGSKPRDVL